MANDQKRNELLDDLLDSSVAQTKPLQSVQSSAETVILDEEQASKAHEIAAQITPADSNSIMNFGSKAQSKLGEFSQNMLDRVQSQDTGEIGDTLTDLMLRLNEANPDDLNAENSNIFKKMFGKVKRSIYEMTAKYQKIGAQIDQISHRLSQQKEILIKDNQVLQELYDQNKTYFEALNIYIAAGQMKLDELNQTDIPNAMAKAKESQNQMDVQTVNDLNHFKSRLEKRIYDLQLARQIALQQAPQIRIIQNTNDLLAEKIQTSINSSIPLWKNQVAIALTLLRQKNAITAQRQVSETTNDLLKKNSAMLKTSSLESAKENERGIVDISTLKQTQKDLVDTIQDTLKIQQEGYQKRQQAQHELTGMEKELKETMLNYINSDETTNTQSDNSQN